MVHFLKSLSHNLFTTFTNQKQTVMQLMLTPSRQASVMEDIMQRQYARFEKFRWTARSTTYTPKTSSDSRKLFSIPNSDYELQYYMQTPQQKPRRQSDIHDALMW